MNYQQIYNLLIRRAKSEESIRIQKKVSREEYFECHHILPRCLGGLGRQSQYFHENIALLTAREHYICHMLLCEIYPDNHKLKLACWMMMNGSRSERTYKISSRLYSKLKEEISKIQSINNIGKIVSKETGKKISDKLKGKLKSDLHKLNLKLSIKNRPKISDETKMKMSLAKLGKSRPPRSEEYRKNISIAQKNRPKISDETRIKMSLAKKGKKKDLVGKILDYEYGS
jgi:hypothetical protein